MGGDIGAVDYIRRLIRGRNHLQNKQTNIRRYRKEDKNTNEKNR